jgi:YVTN family beta-propeller protein
VNVSFIDTSTTPPSVVAAPSSGANQPIGTAITPDGSTALVNNFTTGGLIRFFDLTKTPPVALGDISNVSFGTLILTKDGRFAFGVYPNISSIDVASRKIINTVSLAVGSAAVTPDNSTVIAADPRTNQIAILSLSSRGVLKDAGVRLSHSAFGLNTYTGGIEVAPNGRLALVTNPYDNSVSILRIDGAHNVTESSNRITICCRPWGVAFTRDGAKAYIVNSSSSDVAVLSIDANDNVTDTQTRIAMPNAVLQISPGQAGIGIAKDGRAFVANSFISTNGNLTSGNTVTIIDTNTNVVVGTVQVGQRPTSVGVP